MDITVTMLFYSDKLSETNILITGFYLIMDNYPM